MKTKVIFFEPGFSATTSSVLQTQFLMHAALLEELGFECYFFGADSPENVTAERIGALKKQFNLTECHVYPVTGHGRNWRTFEKSAKIVAGKVLRHIERISPQISYTWHINAALKIEEMGRMKTGKTIFFCQGAVSEEVRLKKRITSFLRAKYIERYEKKLFSKVDSVVAVSGNMKKWLKGISPQLQVDVLPCCFDDSKFKLILGERERIRMKLGWSMDVPVLIYCGGASYWQRLPDIVQFVAEIQKQVPELHLIFLTGAVEIIEQEAEAAGLINTQLEIRSVMHGAVPKWLNAADVGIVLRHDNLVNRVASPIKIGEYLGCGLPVIATCCIGDYSQNIENAKAGLIVDESNNLSAVANFVRDGEEMKRYSGNAQELANLYSWQSGKEKLKLIFKL